MTITVKNAAGTDVAVEVPNANGQATMANSAPVVIASNQSAIPASHETGTIFSGSTALTPKFAAISASSSGNNTIVAAVTGKKIRVLAYTLVCTTAVTAKFKTATGGADLTGAMPFGANGGASAPYCPVGHFETVSGDLLNLVLGSAVAVAGHVIYVEV
jgi:hypothetical protein